MAFVIPPYLSPSDQIVDIYDNDVGRRFARVTKFFAQALADGIQDVTRSGLRTKMHNAYLQYADTVPSEFGGVNDGGRRADVLRRVLQSTYSPLAPANIGQQELEALGSRSASLASAPQSDHMLQTVPIRFFPPAGLTFNFDGGRPLIVTASNSSAGVLNAVFSFDRPTSLLITSTVPFIYGPNGGAPQPATNGVRLINPGTYYIQIEANSNRKFTITAVTPRVVDATSDFELASRGYERAKASKLLLGPMYASLDEFIVNQTFNRPQTARTCAFIVTLFEAYELTHKSLSINVNNN
uniref:VP9 n=1 Tax=viral metagenome TaxID=1070528 RepID=A0A2V0R9R2_9ZZZZ